MQVHELPTIDMPALAERLAGLPHLVFLDSAMPHGTLGRYSYLAADPYAVLDARDGGATLGGEICVMHKGVRRTNNARRAVDLLINLGFW
ncbi:hypothetical protein ACIKTA_11330, partial [Hansschlegelia beijingensis]